MLVLSRGRNEAVVVGNDVKVTVLDIRIGETEVGRGRVRLGFEAPKEVSIQRQEVFDRMKTKTSGSSGTKPDMAQYQRSCQAAPSRTAIVGKRQPLRDAAVRLQIQAPPEISIHCSRASGKTPGHRRIVPPCPTESISADQDHALGLPSIRVINCRKEDNILIGNQLLITIVDVFRFVADSPPSRSGPENFTENVF